MPPVFGAQYCWLRCCVTNRPPGRPKRLTESNEMNIEAHNNNRLKRRLRPHALILASVGLALGGNLAEVQRHGRQPCDGLLPPESGSAGLIALNIRTGEYMVYIDVVPARKMKEISEPDAFELFSY
ncbi:hypothetical protein BKA62DRAFT_674477 [Auriculariales sp. MPI-PUGE-AT-0066]|nr:hypothetical protein BKA62DRAFT_674477 [Auriculariales sp. MPI-PUGE-AT-0066]